MRIFNNEADWNGALILSKLHFAGALLTRLFNADMVFRVRLGGLWGGAGAVPVCAGHRRAASRVCK